MDQNLYVKLAAQVARQTPELAALDAQVAADQPSVDALQQAFDVAASQHAAAVDAQTTASTQLAQLLGIVLGLQQAIDALPPGEDRAALLIELQAAQGQIGPARDDAAAALAALTQAKDVLEAARAALAAPKAAFIDLTTRADAIRAAVVSCQQQIDASGLTVDVAAVQLNAAKTAATLRIDADADAIYGAVQGNRTEEYRTAEAEALAFKAAGYTGTAPSVTSWATAKNWSAQQACDDILATATAWRGAQAAIRAARLARKEQIRVAADSAGIASALAAWATFRAAVRTQLGLPA